MYQQVSGRHTKSSRSKGSQASHGSLELGFGLLEGRERVGEHFELFIDLFLDLSVRAYEHINKRLLKRDGRLLVALMGYHRLKSIAAAATVERPSCRKFCLCC